MSDPIRAALAAPTGAAPNDTQRLDWLIDNCPYFPRLNGHHLAENSRACIDRALAAMAPKQKPCPWPCSRDYFDAKNKKPKSPGL